MLQGARKGFSGETSESGFEGLEPVSQSDRDEERELRLADTKAHTLSRRLHGLQRTILTEHLKKGLHQEKFCLLSPLTHLEQH